MIHQTIRLFSESGNIFRTPWMKYHLLINYFNVCGWLTYSFFAFHPVETRKCITNASNCYLWLIMTKHNHCIWILWECILRNAFNTEVDIKTRSKRPGDAGMMCQKQNWGTTERLKSSFIEMLCSPSKNVWWQYNSYLWCILMLLCGRCKKGFKEST